MNLQQSNNFVYYRQIIVLALAKSSKEKISYLLQVGRDDLEFYEDRILIAGKKYDINKTDLTDYLTLRDYLFPDVPYLFPSKNGKQLVTGRFNFLLKHMVNKPEIKTNTSNPSQSIDKTVSALQCLQFEVKRPAYQKTLAVALLCYLALRPSEIAKLKKSDFDFENAHVKLRATKAQQDQDLPIPLDIYAPFLKYINHLHEDESYLFVNSLGNPWDRKDVHKVVRERGIEKGISRQVTPRCLRPSVIRQLVSQKKVPDSLLVKLLRHKDDRTLHANYLRDLDDELSSTLDDFHPDQPDAGDFENNSELSAP